MKVCENVQKNEKMYFFFFEHVYISNVKQWGLKDQLQKKQIVNPEMIIPATENVNLAEIEMDVDEVKSLQQHTKTDSTEAATRGVA